MSDDEQASTRRTSGEPALTPREREERRRRLAEVFGDVLPEQTRDDTDAEVGGRSGSNEDWLRRQVPPHHG